MRRRLLLAATAAALAPSPGQTRTRAAIGAPAPDFAMADTAGHFVRLADLAGRLLVLEWTNPECPFAGKHYASGNMQALQAATLAAGGAWFTVISYPPGAVGYVEPLEAEAMAESRRSRATAILLDPSTALAERYGALATPHIFLIDREGRLVYHGAVDSIASTRIEDIERATPYLRNALAAVAEGRPIDPPVTRPYGCPVKVV
jgi:hypothetical protein